MCKVNYPGEGDFQVDDCYLFEVSGPKKNLEKIQDVESFAHRMDGTIEWLQTKRTLERIRGAAGALGGLFAVI